MTGCGWIAPTPEEVTTGLADRDCAQSRKLKVASRPTNFLTTKEPMSFELSNPLKDVPGFEGAYSVTSDGCVWSHPRKITRKNGAPLNIAGKWLNQNLINKGYLYVNLCIHNSLKHFLVHRLVAAAWIENTNPLREEVNHKDGVRTNNHVSNLEWCTSQENHLHAWQSGMRVLSTNQRISLSKGTKASMKFSPEQVSEIRKLANSGIRQRRLAERFSVSTACICLIVNEKRYPRIER